MDNIVVMYNCWQAGCGVDGILWKQDYYEISQNLIAGTGNGCGSIAFYSITKRCATISGHELIGDISIGAKGYGKNDFGTTENILAPQLLKAGDTV